MFDGEKQFRLMYSSLDDLHKTIATIRLDSDNNIVEYIDAFCERSDRFCRAYQLAHHRQCRRIYRTLCEFCKPEEMVQEPREAVDALFHTWKTIRDTCGGSVAELISRLFEDACTTHEVSSETENSAFFLILAFADSDMRGTTECLSVIERSLQQLHSDVRRERAEAVDASTQRAELRRRREERAAAAQEAQEALGKAFEEESLYLTELMQKAEGLRCEAEKLGKPRMSTATLHGSSSEGASFDPLGLHSLQRRIESQRDAQARLLTRARNFGRPQSSDAAASLLERAARLYRDNQTHVESDPAPTGDTCKTSQRSCVNDVGLMGTPLPAIAADSPRLKRGKISCTAFETTSARNLSPPLGRVAKGGACAALGVRFAGDELVSQGLSASRRQARTTVPAGSAIESTGKGTPRGDSGAVTPQAQSSETNFVGSGRRGSETPPRHFAGTTGPSYTPISDRYERERLQLLRSKALLLAQIGRLERSTKSV